MVWQLRSDYKCYRSMGWNRYRAFLLAILDAPSAMKVWG